MKQISASLLFALAAIFAPSFSAPTRTLCRCTAFTGSNTLVSTTQITLSTDPCSDLGPSLDDFRQSAPEAFDSLVSATRLDSSPTFGEVPLPTHVLLELAARKEVSAAQAYSQNPLERPISKIVCYAEMEQASEFRDSIVTLFALQVIVTMAVLACIAECISVCVRFMRRHAKRQQHPVQLEGDEQRLLAQTSEKDAYISMSYGAYSDDDDDDEIHRPVM